MLTIELINDGTGKKNIGNYDYRVLVNGKEIASGKVKDHERIGGWQQLVQELAKQVERDKWLSAFAELAKTLGEDGRKSAREAGTQKQP